MTRRDDRSPTVEAAVAFEQRHGPAWDDTDVPMAHELEPTHAPPDAETTALVHRLAVEADRLIRETP